MIKYETACGRISKVDVIKETAKTLLITTAYDTSGTRRSKRSDWYNYHDSFEDAKDFLIAEQKLNIVTLNGQIVQAEAIISNLIELKE